MGYNLIMIRSFTNRGLEDFFYDGTLRGIRPDHARRLGLLLDRLNAAGDVKDMNFPGSSLHPLKGNRKGIWAVKVSGNWRVTFHFESGDASVVDYEDYH